MIRHIELCDLTACSCNIISEYFSMPTPDFHQKLVDNNKKTLELLPPEKSFTFAWIVTITYYTALHVVEVAMSEFDVHDPLRPHTEHLEFLERKNVAAKQYLHKLHVLSESMLTGRSLDDVILQRSGVMFKENGICDVMLKWLSCIENAVI